MRRRPLCLSVLAVLIGLAPEADAAIRKGPWVQKVGPTSAVVRVEVDPPMPVTVELQGATVGDAGALRFESTAKTALHAIEVTGLTPSTRVTYTVRASGEAKHAAITTAPEDGAGKPFRFLVYGDNRSDDAAHAAIVRAMVAAPSELLVNTGDLVAEGGSPSDWQRFFDIEAPLLRERGLYACIGNHELIDGAGIEFARYFGQRDVSGLTSGDGGTGDGGGARLTPELLNGTFRWGSARFFLLNGMVSMQGGATREWLEKELTAADTEKDLVWRVLVVHHGPWSAGPHGENKRLVDGGVVELLKKHKVDLVLAGHDHIYERGMAENGIPYIVSGGGGAPTYKIKPTPHTKKFESVRHFVEASVSVAAIQFVATRVDGTVIERCGLRKEPAGWDCDQAAVAPPPPPPATKCGCDVVGGPRTPFAALAASALAGIATLRRRRRDPAQARERGR